MPPVIRYAGFAEEWEPNQSPPPDAVYHVDIASATLDAPSDPQIVFPGGLGRGAVNHRPGAYSPTGNIVQGAVIQTIGWLFKWALGGYEYTAGAAGTNAAQTITVTGSPDGGSFTLVDWRGNVSGSIDYNDDAETVEGVLEALPTIGAGNVSCSGGALPGTPVVCTFVGDLAEQPVPLLTVGTNGLTGGSDPEVAVTTSTPGVLPDWNVHEIYAVNNNVLPTFCARIGKDLFEHVFSGCGINNLQLQSQNEFVMVTADVIAAQDHRDDIKAIADLLLPDGYPLAFHEVTVTQGANGISCAVRNLELSIGNNLNAVYGQGSRHPCHRIAGGRDVTLSMELLYDSLDHLQSFWGGTDGPAATGAQEFQMTLRLDAGADGEIDIALPRSIYTAVPTQPSGRDEITQSIATKAFETVHMLADFVTEVRSELLVTIQNRVGEMAAIDPDA